MRWSGRPAAGSATRPGPGAAGGVGFAMLALAGQFAELELRPGVDLVMEEAGFDRALATSQLVITGEGRIDAQTAYGKTALGVAKRAQAAGRPCIAFGGGVTPEGIEALAAVGAIAVPIVEAPQDLETAIAAGTAPVERCGERIARLFSAAMDLPGRDAAPVVIPTRPTTACTSRPQRSGRRSRRRSAPAASPIRSRPGPTTSVATGRGSRATSSTQLTARVRRAGLGVAPRPHERADPHDPHPEHRRRERREGVRGAADRLPQRSRAGGPQARHRLGRRRPVDRAAARLGEGRVRAAARAHRRHPAGRPRAPEGAPAPGDAAPHPRAARRLLARVPGRRCRRSRHGTGSPPSTASARRPPRSCCCSASGRR